MSDSEGSIQEQLAALRQAFVDQLPQRISKLYDAHIAWGRKGEGLAEYYRLAHSLTGAGATFACDGVSRAARQLELFLKAATENGQFSVQIIEEAAVLLGVVRQEAEAVSTPPGPAESRDHADATVDFEASRLALAEDARLVYLLGGEETLGSDIAGQLTMFGFRVQSYAIADDLARAVNERRPGAILADVALPEGAEAGIDAVADIQRQQETPVPTVFFSNDCDDFNKRLAAARAWGMVYLSKPLAVDVLADAIDSLVDTDVREAHRILIVDAHQTQAEQNAALLQDAGMVVALLTDPMRLFDALAGFSPELVLMGTSIPLCNGAELAAVVRQQPEYVDLPMVFLSSEDERRIAPRVDDCWASNVDSNNLVRVVQGRAERYRTLRVMSCRDALTGLLDHSHVMEMLECEVARSMRYDAPLSFALLDIDFLKAVNETYGHSVGDSVIKSLSRVIQQRLRKSDVIGRYGGEEFAIVMPETPVSAASSVMNDVRRLFESVVHHAGDKCFSLTLSCGVAALSPASFVGELCKVAEQMVRQAKESGRNQVVSGQAK